MAKFCFCVFIDRDEVEVHKHTKGRRAISSHLDRTSLVKRGFTIRGRTIKNDPYTYHAYLQGLK